MLRSSTLLFVMFFVCATEAFAQIDTLRILRNQLITAQLKPGMKQFLVYMQNPKTGNVKFLSLWNRRTEFKKMHGQDVVVISQKWFMDDSLYVRDVYSICRKDNFQPLYHYSSMPKTGVEAFHFGQESIVGSDTVANNTKKDFVQALTEPTLNWELDLEILEMLPYEVGKTFALNFYHPGGKTLPQYYLYKVIGDEAIATSDGGRLTDCWKLRIDYNTPPGSYAVWWISKQSKDVLKMQEHFNGRFRYKVRLATPTE